MIGDLVDYYSKLKASESSRTKWKAWLDETSDCPTMSGRAPMAIWTKALLGKITDDITDVSIKGEFKK